MYLIDKYRPTDAKSAYFHEDLFNLLTVMSKDEEIPHIIFYGPEGSGKKTIIKIFLELLFDSSINKTRDTTYKVVGSGNKKTDEIVKQSNYHIVIEPKNNNFDRYLIHDIVKEYAKRKSLGIFKTNRQFKIVLINNLDNMSYYAQTSLRRTIERYNDKCRFIMWCKSLSKVIKPLQSRCICLRVPAPTDNKLFGYVFNVSVKENMVLTLDQYCNIVKNSKGNVKQALWELQFLKFGYDLNTNYTTSIQKIIQLMLEAKICNILIIKNILFSLMITNVNGTTIMRDIIDLICTNSTISDNLKYKIIDYGAEIEHQLIKGRREIIQIDTFVISSIKFIHEEKNAKSKLIKN